MQWSIENIVRIKIKHWRMNKISVLNNPWEFDVPLNNNTKPTNIILWVVYGWFVGWFYCLSIFVWLFYGELT